MKNIVINEIVGIAYITNNNPQERKSSYCPNLVHQQLIMFLEGECVTRLGGKVFHSKPGMIAVYPCGEWGSYSVERSDATACIDIIYDANDSELPSEPAVFSAEECAYMRPRFERVWNMWKKKAPGYLSAIRSEIYAILAQLEALEHREYTPKSVFEKLRPAEEYIEKNAFSPDIDCSCMHTLCNLSYTYFKTLFVRRHRVTPQKYIEQRRMKYACELLKTQCFSISEISSMVGYSNVYYFSRVFKTAFGAAPSQWLKRSE